MYDVRERKWSRELGSDFGVSDAVTNRRQKSLLAFAKS